MTKMMLVHPFADFSVKDVSDGLLVGLRALDVEVAEYSLSRRLRVTAPGLTSMVPPGDRVSPEMIARLATEGLTHRTVIENCPWVLIVCGAYVHPDVLLSLRWIGVKIAVLFTESPYEAHSDGEFRLTSVCDVAFTNERTCVPAFQRALDDAGNGGRAFYFQHAFDPARHHPPTPTDEPLDPGDMHEVVFVGTGFEERQRLFEAVNWTGIDLALGGMWPGIEHYGTPHRLAPHLMWPCIGNADTARIYRGAKIGLNPHRWAARAESANPRVYELAACGVFQVCDERAEIGDVFGDSVPMYPPGVPWRMEAIVRHYLKDDAARREMAAEAKRRVAPHTFAARARGVLDAMASHERTRSAA